MGTCPLSTCTQIIKTHLLFRGIGRLGSSKSWAKELLSVFSLALIFCAGFIYDISSAELIAGSPDPRGVVRFLSSRRALTYSVFGLNRYIGGSRE